MRHEVGHQQRQVFPHAACVVTLVDRLVHRADVIEIEADSHRLEEAKELRTARPKQRRATALGGGTGLGSRPPKPSAAPAALSADEAPFVKRTHGAAQGALQGDR